MEKISIPLSETRSLAAIFIMRKKMIAFATKKSKKYKVCNYLLLQYII